MKAPQECNSIDEIRDAIDSIDLEVITALGKRFEYVKSITRFKKTVEEVKAPERYQAVLKQRRIWAVESGLDPDIIEQMYRLMIAYFIDEELKELQLVDAN